MGFMQFKSQQTKLISWLDRWLPWLVLLILIGTAAILWQPLRVLLGEADPAKLQAEVDQLGMLAPLGFFALSIIQIVGAPIPGYPVQLLGGVLFGTWLGGIYSIIGMVLGGLLSAWLSRRLGRSFIEKQLGQATLAKYENLAQLETLWMWFIILSIPLGDIPYYLAGLSRVRYATLALAILLSRGPFTFVISWAGETALSVPGWIIWAILVIIIIIIVLGYLIKDKLSLWVDTYILQRLS